MTMTIKCTVPQAINIREHYKEFYGFRLYARIRNVGQVLVKGNFEDVMFLVYRK